MEIHLQNGEPLDLPPDLQLSVSQQNPLLSEQGTYSLQVSLPASPRNIRLLSHPDRLDGYYKFMTKAPAFVKQGIFQKKATMCLLEGGGDPDNDDIDATLLMNESELYASMKETQLSAAFAVKRQASEFLPDMTFADDIDRLVKYLELVKVNNIKDDFLLFEVGTDGQPFSLDSDPNHALDVFQFLNEEYRRLDRLIQPTYDTDLNGIKYVVFRARYPYSVYLNDSLVDVPKGYGITPFLRLSYIINRIFEYFGYNLKYNPFSDTTFENVVILNNTADAIVNGWIDYSQLVPSCTIDDFFETIRQAFGCEFFITPDNREIEIKFWKDILESIQMERDYTPFLSGIPRITYSQPKSVKQTFSRSLKSASTPTNTLTEFERINGNLMYISTLPENIPRGQLDNISTGFYFVQGGTQIWEVYYNANTGHNEKKYYCQPFFDYYVESDKIDFDDHSSKIEYVPNVFGFQRVGLILSSDDLNAYQTYIGAQTLDIGERRHMNTILEATDTGTNTTQIVKETGGDTAIMMLYYRASVIMNPITLLMQTYTSGRAFRYDIMGNEIIGSFDLIPGGDYGLFNTFYKSLDNVLRNSFHLVTVPLKLPEAEIATYRNDRLVCVNNQPLLPDTLEYIVGENNIDVNKATLRTVRPYFDRE